MPGLPTAVSIGREPVRRKGVAVSRPVRRILYGPAPVAAIHLGRRLPDGSCGLPGDDRTGSPSPVRPCSRWGLPSHPGRPGCWCALTAPFHPCLCAVAPSAVCSLWHFPAGHPDWALPSTAPCGVRTFLGPVLRAARYAAARPAHCHLQVTTRRRAATPLFARRRARRANLPACRARRRSRDARRPGPVAARGSDR
jgi:hypothetical protein